MCTHCEEEGERFDFVLLKFSQLLKCELCGVASRALRVSNEPVFDDHGCISGIEAKVRFYACKHEVPGAEADPVALAAMMNEMAEL